LAVKTGRDKYVDYITKIELIDGIAQYSNKTQSFILTISMAILAASRKLHLLKDTSVRKIPKSVLKRNLMFFYDEKSNGYVNKIMKEFFKSPFISHQDEEMFVIKSKKDIVNICLDDNVDLKKALVKERLTKDIVTGNMKKNISLIGKTLERDITKDFSLSEYKNLIVLFEACKPMFIENSVSGTYVPFYNFSRIATITRTSASTISKTLKNMQKIYSFELITLKKHSINKEDFDVVQERQDIDDQEKAFLTVVKLKNYNAVLKFNGTRVLNNFKYKMFTLADTVFEKTVEGKKVFKEYKTGKFIKINKTSIKLSSVKKVKKSKQNRLEFINLDNAPSQAVLKMANSFKEKVASKHEKLLKIPGDGVLFENEIIFQIKGTELKKVVEKVAKYCDFSKSVCSDGKVFRKSLKNIDVNLLYEQRSFLHGTKDKRKADLEIDAIQEKCRHQKI